MGYSICLAAYHRFVWKSVFEPWSRVCTGYLIRLTVYRLVHVRPVLEPWSQVCMEYPISLAPCHPVRVEISA